HRGALHPRSKRVRQVPLDGAVRRQEVAGYPGLKSGAARLPVVLRSKPAEGGLPRLVASLTQRAPCVRCKPPTKLAHWEPAPAAGFECMSHGGLAAPGFNPG